MPSISRAARRTGPVDDPLPELLVRAQRHGVAAAFRWLLEDGQSHGRSAQQLGALHERLLDALHGSRRRSGAYYTPPALVQTLLDHALEPILAAKASAALGQSIERPADFARLAPLDRKCVTEAILSTTVLDPACGAGAFLAAAAERLFRWLRAIALRSRSDDELRHDIARRCLFGIDSDETAALLTRFAVGAGENIHHGDSLLDSSPWPGRRFDVVIGNPPFANAIEGLVDPSTKKRLSERCPELRGTADLAFYFLAAAHSFAAADGAVGLVLPRTALSAPAAAKLRERLLEERPPAFLAVPSDPLLFPGANVFVTLAVLRHGKSCIVASDDGFVRNISIDSENWWRALQDGMARNGIAPAWSGHSPRSTAARNLPPPRGRSASHASRVGGPTDERPPIDRTRPPTLPSPAAGGGIERETAGLVPKQEEERSQTVSDVFDVCASMTAGEAYELAPYVLEGDNQTPGLRFITTGLIDPAVSHWGTKTCRYLGRKFQHPTIDPPVLPERLARRIARMRRPKVLVAGLSTRIEAFLDARGDYVGAVSTYSVFHPQDDLKALTDLCDRLNSDATADLLRRELGATALGGGRITVTKRFLKGLRV